MSSGRNLLDLAADMSPDIMAVRGDMEGSRFNQCVRFIASEIDHYEYGVCGWGMSATEDNARKLGKRWFKHCQQYGFLPPAWRPIWWLIRGWMLRALIDLAMRWLLSLQTGSVVVSSQDR